MKLYATTTSERASKGQGGNDFITVDLKYEPSSKEYQFFARLHLSVYKDKEGQNHFRLYFQPRNDQQSNELLKHIIVSKDGGHFIGKGKQQKGNN